MSPARASSSPTRSRPRKGEDLGHARLLDRAAVAPERLDRRVRLDRAGLDPPGQQAAEVRVALERAREHDEGPVGGHPRRRDVAPDQLEQGRHAGRARRGGIRHRPALPRRGEQGRKIELRLGRAERREQVEHLVVHRVRALVRPVDLVDHHDRAQPQAQRLAEHELGLRHRTLGGIDQQQHAVDHGQDALDLAAEIGMARRVDDVDARALPDHGGAFRQDRDAALALEVVPVQRALGDLLIGAEGAALLEQAVDQGGLAVVDVGDDGDVAQIHGHGPKKAARAGPRCAGYGPRADAPQARLHALRPASPARGGR